MSAPQKNFFIVIYELHKSMYIPTTVKFKILSAWWIAWFTFYTGAVLRAGTIMGLQSS
jgi:hypothetical protein